jgi:hypothetical protein
MSFMFDVYYQSPADPVKEEKITEMISRFGGSLSFRERQDHEMTESVCLTYEFDELRTAAEAAVSVRQREEHVEGPVGYDD